MQTLLANCASWQTWTQSGDAATASAHIFLFAPTSPDGVVYTDEELDELRPFAVIYPTDRSEYTLSKDSGGGANYFNELGNLVIRFEDETPAEYQASQALTEMSARNLLGAVIDDIRGLAGTDTADTSFLSVHEVKVTSVTFASLASVPSEGHSWQGDVAIGWGT